MSARSLKRYWIRLLQGNRLLHLEVTEKDIADVVSKWTGIPVNSLLASEREKLLHLADELHKRVVGQDEAVSGLTWRRSDGVHHRRLSSLMRFDNF